MIFLLKLLNNSLGETNKLNWHPDKSSEFGIFQPAKQEREEPEGWWAGHVKFQLAARAKRRQEEKKKSGFTIQNTTSPPPHPTKGVPQSGGGVVTGRIAFHGLHEHKERKK